MTQHCSGPPVCPSHLTRPPPPPPSQPLVMTTVPEIIRLQCYSFVFSGCRLASVNKSVCMLRTGYGVFVRRIFRCEGLPHAAFSPQCSPKRKQRGGTLCDAREKERGTYERTAPPAEHFSRLLSVQPFLKTPSGNLFLSLYIDLNDESMTAFLILH